MGTCRAEYGGNGELGNWEIGNWEIGDIGTYGGLGNWYIRGLRVDWGIVKLGKWEIGKLGNGEIGDVDGGEGNREIRKLGNSGLRVDGRDIGNWLIGK